MWKSIFYFIVIVYNNILKEVINMSEENLAKLRLFKERLIIRENTEKDINDFLKDFFNYYYNSKMDFIMKNLEDFHNYIVLALDKIEKFALDYEREIDYSRITKMDINEKIMILKKFFSELKIDIPLDEMLNNGIIDIETLEDDITIKDDLFNGLRDLDNGKVCLKLYNTDTILDLFVWIHEIMHYYNYDKEPQTNARYLLTESIAYAWELILSDYLSKLKYDYEVAVYQGERFSYFFDVLFNAYYILKAYIVFDKTHELNIKNYKLVFGSIEDYDTCLNIFCEEVDKDFSVLFSVIPYSIAAALGPFMYIEWEYDHSFINNILRINKSINSKDFYGALTDIRLYGFDEESTDKVQEDLEIYVKEIDEGTDYIIGNLATVNDYFKDLVKMFYDSKNMLFDRIDDILKVKEFVIDNLYPYFDSMCPNPEIDKLTKLGKTEKIKIIQDYYEYMGYDIDLGDLINYVNFNHIELDNLEEDPFEFSINILHGDNDDDSYYNMININESGYLLDTVAWIHEFRHFLNYPNHKRNQVSYALTESVSFIEEFMFLDYLEKIGYIYDSSYCKFETLNMFYVFAIDSYPISKLLSIYVNKGFVSKENYNNTFNDDRFEDLLSECVSVLKDDTSHYIDGVRYSIGALLALYMYSNYKKDKSYLKTILEFERHINDNDLELCLNILGLTGIDKYSLDKIIIAINEYLDKLNYLRRNGIISMYDINHNKVKRLTF